MEPKMPAFGSWKAVLAGVLPFLISGPVLVLLSYPPILPVWMKNPAWLPGLVLVALPIGIGFAVGWQKGFPFWSYSYLVLVLVFCLVSGSALLSGSMTWADHQPVFMLIGLLTALIVLLLVFRRNNFSTGNIRHDYLFEWTRLSLGLMVLPTAVFSSIDYDQYPAFTFAALIPGLILSLAALIGLRVRSGSVRSRLIMIAMSLVLVVQLLQGQWYFLIYWILMAFLVISPLLLRKQARVKSAHF